VTPALGLAWSHCVNSRILLERSTASFLAQVPSSSSSSFGDVTHLNHSTDPSCYSSSGSCGGGRMTNGNAVVIAMDKENYPRQSYTGATRSRRRLSVVFSSYLPSQSCEFEITSSGLYGCKS